MYSTMKKLLIIPIFLGMLALGGVASYAGFASAETDGVGKGLGARLGQMKMGDHLHGTVTEINGSVFTITSEKDNTGYTIEAKDADVHVFTEGEKPEDGSITDIKVGDDVGARGTLSGTVLTATDVMDGMPEGGKGGHHGGRGHGLKGTVQSVNGDTVTLEGKDGKTYTVNAGDASVTRMVDGTLSDVVAGDQIGVRGTLDGTAITAKHIMDDLKERSEEDDN